MGIVCLALIPNIIAGGFIFGPRALLLYAVCAITCVLAEYLSCKVIKKPNTIGDLSAVVTGLLLAATLPVDTPLWIAAFGSVVAIVVVKIMFGGIGFNFANPAATARIVLLVAFPGAMAVYGVLPQYAYDETGAHLAGESIVDTVSSATPLAMHDAGQSIDYMVLFLGQHAGSIGEVSIIALLIGALIMFAFRIIDGWAPLSFILTIMGLAVLTGEDPIFQLLSGGLVLGAFYMATDYTTTPITWKGKLIFGIGAGIITAGVRFVGFSIEAVAFAILFMNLLTPIISKLTEPKPLGGVQRVIEE